MSYRIILRTVLMMVLSTFLVFSCQESDDLYGTSPDDYTPDTGAAAAYFSAKEAACVTDKEDFTTNLANGWVNVGLIYQDSKGNLKTTPEADLVFARLRLNYETINGGIMELSLVNRLGYRKNLRLYPCNAKDSYFYVADLSTPTLVETVLAFSISDNDTPGTTSLGRELTLMDGRHKIVGITVRRGQSGEGELHAKLGNVQYLAYLLRSKRSVQEIPSPAGTFDVREFDGQVSGAVTNGVQLRNSQGTGQLTIKGLVTAYRGYSTTTPYTILRAGTRNTGSGSVAIYETDPGLASVETYMPIDVYDGSRRVLSFSAWVGTGLISTYGTRDSRLTIRL